MYKCKEADSWSRNQSESARRILKVDLRIKHYKMRTSQQLSKQAMKEDYVFLNRWMDCPKKYE